MNIAMYFAKKTFYLHRPRASVVTLRVIFSCACTDTRYVVIAAANKNLIVWFVSRDIPGRVCVCMCGRKNMYREGDMRRWWWRGMRR